jgi:co-chaperonin GroES (HSP10)
MEKQSYQPLGTRVILSPLKVEEQRKSGLIIPETAANNANLKKGEVLFVGDEAKKVKVGDLVLYEAGAVAELELDEKPVALLFEQNIAIVL